VVAGEQSLGRVLHRRRQAAVEGALKVLVLAQDGAAWSGRAGAGSKGLSSVSDTLLKITASRQFFSWLIWAGATGRPALANASARLSGRDRIAGLAALTPTARKTDSQSDRTYRPSWRPAIHDFAVCNKGKSWVAGLRRP
jgi:hypothetical protein